MSAVSFRKDAEELLRLSALTESQNVKRILSLESEKLQKLADVEEQTSGTSAKPTAPKAIHNTPIVSKIFNYAWDQSDKFMKIYVTLNGVHDLPAENISTQYNTKSFELSVLGKDNKVSTLTINNLLHEIVPSESYHKIKTDMVTLYLKKQVTKEWQYVTETDLKAKEAKTPKFAKDEDPGASLMNFMKHMYQEGDDEMKRTIAKAWTEARDKKDMSDSF